MYTVKALVLAFLAGVVLAGGTALVFTPSAPAPLVAPVSCPPPLNTPSSVPSKAWEYSKPASTSGGVRPTSLKNNPPTNGG